MRICHLRRGVSSSSNWASTSFNVSPPACRVFRYSKTAMMVISGTVRRFERIDNLLSNWVSKSGLSLNKLTGFSPRINETDIGIANCTNTRKAATPGARRTRVCERRSAAQFRHLSCEWCPTGEHLVCDHTQAVNVRLRAESLATTLLRRHVE